MAETIGDLIDRLTIANIRLWHVEDARREYCKLEDSEKTKEEAEELLNKVTMVNKDRNDLIDQINAALAVLFDNTSNKNSKFVISVEELLGHGKNKFYKTEEY